MRSSRFPHLQRNFDLLVSAVFALFPAAIVGGVKGMAWPVTLVGMAGARPTRRGWPGCCGWAVPSCRRATTSSR